VTRSGAQKAVANAKPRNGGPRGDAKRRGDPADEAFRLDESPFYWVNRVSGRYVQDMERGLKAVGMDMPGWRTLMILREQSPRSVSEIAELAAMRLSTMTRVVQRLAGAGFVEVATSREDARRTEVRLAAKGREALGSVRAAASRVYRQGVGDLSAAEITQLVALLERLFGNLATRPKA
jgi:DNA-binding MarR family transcriptional regulator